MLENFNDQNKERINPKVKEVLALLGLTGFVIASVVMPGLPLALKPFVGNKNNFQKQKKLWSKYNPYILRQTLKRLQMQKVVEFLDIDGVEVIRIAEKGKVKLLKYKIEDLKIHEQVWDGKWRLIIYDIPVNKKIQRDLFRRFIQKMNLYQLQESVYLTPYHCELEIEYLRNYFGVGEHVVYLKIEKLENEDVYKRYFGLN